MNHHRIDQMRQLSNTKQACECDVAVVISHEKALCGARSLNRKRCMQKTEINVHQTEIYSKFCCFCL